MVQVMTLPTRGPQLALWPVTVAVTGSVSVITTPWAARSPVLVTVIVYATGSPVNTVPGLPVLTTSSTAAGAGGSSTVVVSLSAPVAPSAEVADALFV